LKVSDGESVTAGAIIMRQRGLSIKAGPGVGVGRDYTLYARKAGVLKFEDRGSRGKIATVIDK
jgi:large subunit ribosomal protein L27